MNGATQFNDQQLEVNLDVQSLVSCSVSAPSLIDFGRTADNPVGLTSSFNVTATCSGGVIYDHDAGSGAVASTPELFRINILSPTNELVNCSLQFGKCIPFKINNNTNDTSVGFYATSGSDSSTSLIPGDGVQYIHSAGVMPEIDGSDGGTSTMNVTAKIYANSDGSAPTIGVHTATAVVTLYYN